MEQSKDKPRIIENLCGATVALCLTGIVTALSFVDALPHLLSKPSYWLLDLRWIFPAPVAAAVNVGFYAYLGWLGVMFYRYAQGKERILVAGWFVSLFLGLIQNLVSMSAAATFNWLKAACMLIALLAAFDIFLKTFAGDNPRLDDQDSRNL